MFRRHLIVLKIACLGLLSVLSTSVPAVFVDLASVNTQLNGHTVVPDSGPMHLGFSATLANSAPLVLDVLIEDDDLLNRRPYMAFSANLLNLSGAPLDVLVLELSGAATFDNTVNFSASGLIDQDPSEQVVTMTFDSPVTQGASLGIGRPDGIPDFDDWLIYLNNMVAGDRFTLTIGNGDNLRTLLQANAVPEPATILLCLLGFGLIAKRRILLAPCHAKTQ